MRRIVWVVAVLALVGYVFYSRMENKARLEAEHAEKEKIEQATKTAVSQMASRTNAVTDWEPKLRKGRKSRFGLILTVELERLWLQQRPILFIGAINDIATHDQHQYVVSIEGGLLGSFRYISETKLQLSLISDKILVDSFLNDHPHVLKGDWFKYNIAVVAHVSSIRTTYFLGEEGQREEVKIGDGELIDILYTGGVTF